MWQRLADRLTARGRALFVLAVVAVAVALCAPSLTTGLVADDWVQELVVEGRAPPGLPQSRLDLFTFASGAPADVHALVDSGVFPWWADPTAKLSFFRPITSATHWLDHRLWGRSPTLMHAQNLCWWALALCMVAWVYRRYLGATSGVALLALVLYAVDDAHGPAVGWVANRNAFVALALSLPSLVWHDRWRRDGWRPGAWLAPLSLAVGLLAGEAALATTAYLAAYTFHLERSRGLGRFAPMLPSLAVVVVWTLVYRMLGFGAAHSGVYLDPGAEPAAFLSALPRRATALWAGQFFLPWSDFATLYGYLSAHAAATMTWVLAVTSLVLALGFVGVWRRDPVARFFATGVVLATVPICSTFPADRLLFFVGVGAMGLVAQLLVGGGRWPVRVLATIYVIVHLVMAPPLLAIRSRSMLSVEAPLARAERSIPWAPSVRNQTVVLVNPPADLFVGYVLLTRRAQGTPEPERLRWLSATPRGVEVQRVDDRTMLVRPVGGFTAEVSEQMLRSPRRPLHVGDRVELTGVDITLEGATEKPTAARFVFDRSLEDPSLVWLKWDIDRFAPFALPAVGERVTLPPIDFLRAVFAP